MVTGLLANFRVRLLLLVFSAAIPLLGLLLYMALDQRRLATTEVKAGALALGQYAAA